MKMLWLCRWNDSFCSFVLARSKQEAESIIPDVLEHRGATLEPVDHRASFMCSFQACYEQHEEGPLEPHWHATDDVSEDIFAVLGEPPAPPPPPPPPPDPDEAICQRCGQGRFARQHHPDYQRDDRCTFVAPSSPDEQVPPTSSPGEQVPS